MEAATAIGHGEGGVAPLVLPPTVNEAGLLLGWSLEHEQRRLPIGFVRAAPPAAPEHGYLEPILLAGSGHLMTVATTGAGKGVGCIIPALLRYEGPVIVVDPKGENYAVTARRRRELGHRVVLLDPFGVTAEEERDSLNPVDLIDAAHPSRVDDAAVLAELACGGGRAFASDPFWDMRARQLITACLLYCAMEQPEPLRTLGEVRYLLSQPEKDLEYTAKDMARSKDPDIRQMASILATPADRTRAGIVSSAQNFVEFLRGENVARATTSTSFDLDAVRRGEPLSIYLVIPPDKLESHAQLLRLWVGTLIAVVLRRRRPPPRETLLLLDEAAQLGELPQLRQAITLLRGYGLKTWSFWQDLSQLRRLYRDDWETMLNNCRVLQLFGLNNMRLARAAAELTGYPHPGELLDLDADEHLLAIAGDEPVIAQRPNYLTDPVFAGQFDANPLHTPVDDDEVSPRRPQRHFRRQGLRARWIQPDETIEMSGGVEPAPDGDDGDATPAGT